MAPCKRSEAQPTHGVNALRAPATPAWPGFTGGGDRRYRVPPGHTDFARALANARAVTSCMAAPPPSQAIETYRDRSTLEARGGFLNDHERCKAREASAATKRSGST